MNKVYTIYQTTNLTNGKIYIGKHICGSQCRHKPNEQGVCSYLGSGTIISKAIEKYGVENFVKELLYILEDENQMNLTEANIVDEEFIQREDTYNVMPGGKGGRQSPKIEKKRLENSRSALRKPEVRAKISSSKMAEKNPMFGKPGTNLGKIFSKGVCARISAGKQGIPTILS